MIRDFQESVRNHSVYKKTGILYLNFTIKYICENNNYKFWCGKDLFPIHF